MKNLPQGDLRLLSADVVQRLLHATIQARLAYPALVTPRSFVACGRPAWEVTREDVDRVVAGLAAPGLAASTRRCYVQTFKGFHAFLVARKAAEIEAAFGNASG